MKCSRCDGELNIIAEDWERSTWTYKVVYMCTKCNSWGRQTITPDSSSEEWEDFRGHNWSKDVRSREV